MGGTWISHVLRHHGWQKFQAPVTGALVKKRTFRDFLGTMREMRDLGDTLACKGPFTTVLIDYSACGNGVCWESSKLSFEYLFNIVESVSMEMTYLSPYLSKLSMPVMACYHSVLWHNASWQNNPQLPPIPILCSLVSLSSCILVTLTSVKLIPL